MGKVTRKKVQKVVSAPQPSKDVNSRNMRSRKRSGKSAELKKNIMEKTISSMPKRKKVQKVGSALQPSKDVNSRSLRSHTRSRKSVENEKNIMERTISSEPNETPFQNMSPFEVAEVTNDDDVIIITDTSYDPQHENVHESIVPNIENDIIDLTNTTISNIAQNNFQPISKIIAPEIENDKIIDITGNKTITKKSSVIATSSDDDVKFISCISGSKNHIDERVISLDSSEDEENTPHQKPIEKSINNKSIKERLGVRVNLTKTNKRKYNFPLRNCKRSRIDEITPNVFNSDLGKFVIDKHSSSHFSNNLKNIGHTATTLTQKHVPLSSTSSIGNKKLRPIVIDGMNIGHAHGGQGNFSVKGIDLCITYFANRGHSDIVAFIPQHRQGPPGSETNTLLSQLMKKGHICYTPSRKVQNIRMTCYDDRILLDYANQCGGVVVSNDNFRDLYNEKDAFKDIIENRQVMVTFVRDKIIVPEDQYNRRSNVRSLSDILCFPS